MKPLLVAAAAMLMLGGCAVVKVGDGTDDGQPLKFVVVPAGEMPPTGLCRVWYPDRPYAKQPSPGECSKLRENVPEGAYLIRT